MQTSTTRGFLTVLTRATSLSCRVFKPSRIMLALALSLGANTLSFADDSPPVPFSSSNAETRMILRNDPILFGDVIRLAGELKITTWVSDNKARLNNYPVFYNGTDGLSFENLLQLADIEKTIEILGRTASAKEARGLFMNALNDSTLTEATELLNQAEKARFATCQDRTPRIHNIGLGSILVFERDKTISNRALRIPVDGRDLDPRCVTFSVQVGGETQLERNPNNMLYINEPSITRPDQANIVLLDSLVNKFATGDRLTVQVAISERNTFNDSDKKPRVVTYATRTFTLYEQKEYRKKVLESRIDPRDIAAFPLSDQETKDLFGEVINNHYFVVRMSFSNATNIAKLINTGLIRAEGRAIVEPDSKTEQLPYTVPVMASPQSLQHVYSILDGTEPAQPRSKVFRFLEFFGTLATGVNGLTAGAVRATQNIGLLTGIGIPEGKKLFPDAVPNYRKNLVDYAMPELFKVPANSQTGHKYLFFSKNDIEAVIADHHMYLGPSDLPSSQEGKRLSKVNPAPAVRVISLAFDALDVRFEKMSDVVLDAAKDTLMDMITSIPTDLANLNTALAESFSQPEERPVDNKDKVVLETISHIKTAIPKLSNTNNLRASYQKMFDQIDLLSKNTLDGADKGGHRIADLKDNPAFGLTALTSHQTVLANIVSHVNRGQDASLYEDKIDAAKQAFNQNKLALTFYQDVAKALRGNIKNILDNVKTEAAKTPPNESALTFLKNELANALFTLEEMHPQKAPVDKLMGNEVKWDILKNKFAN